jgi:PAS domain S-box-containing protein
MPLTDDEILRLRQKAEQLASQQQEEPSDLSLEELNHELNVRRIELEMQNQQLRETEQQLAESLEQFTRLYHKAPIGYVTFDQKGVIVNLNETFARLCEKPAAELRQSYFADLLSEDSAAVFRQRLPAFFKQPAGKTLSVWLKSAQNKPLCLEIRGERESYDHLLSCSLIDITKEKLAEQELLASKDRLNSLFKRMESCVVIYQALEDGEDFIIVDLNKAAEQAENIDRKTVVGQRLTEVFPTVEEFGLLKILRQVWLTGRAEHHPIKEYSDGRIKGWRENYVYQLKSGEIVAIYKDLTAQKQVEQALASSEERLALATAGTRDGLWDLDLQTEEAYISERFCTMLGYQPGELPNSIAAWTDLLHPDDAAAAQDTLQKYLARETDHYQSTFRLRAKDGSYRWINGRGEATWDENGKPLRITGFNTDISEQKELENQLKENERKYRTLVNEAKVGIALADAQTGIILECNQALADMLERSREELLGQPQSILHPAEHLTTDGRTENFIKHQQELPRLPAVQKCLTKSGKLLDVEIKGKKIDYEGRPVMLGIFHDLTERIKLQEQLRQKFKMEAIGVMAGGIAHNFNNNLSIILGNVELAQLRTDNPQLLDELLDYARTAVLRSRDLIQQILTYSRQGGSQKNPVHLSLVVEESLNLLRSTIPSSVEISFSAAKENQELTVLADSGRIQEVILNLCSNAIHAMDECGKLSIEIDHSEVTSEDIPQQYNCQSGHYLRLSLTDTGCGMDSKTIEQIFDPFFTTKEVNQGTGMGLATVQGIINQHQGFIKVHSEPGKGSRFELYFPAQTSAAPQTSRPKERPIRRGQGRVLFVDDEEMLAQLGEALLTELGYQVTSLTSSKKALQLFAADPQAFDLVLTDQTMPNMTGIELARSIQQIRSDIPIILCSGYSSKISKKSRQQGISAFCTKPLELSELSEILKQFSA